ncbi:unnamed protein product [Trichobilharzia regenti]|nr:unnamed protein product [Trichobilharzia regenti]
MEKGVAALNKSLDELENASDISKAAEALQRVLETMCGVKRKCNVNYCSALDEVTGSTGGGQKSEESVSKNVSIESEVTTKPRLSHPFDESSVSLARFQRHLTDYLFTSGQPQSALKFAQEKQELGDLCMLEVYDEAVSIEKALLEGDTGPAFAWLQEANFKLKKNDSYYEFDLRVFEFYLLVKQGKRIDAIQHARKYMSSIKQDDDYRANKLGQAMILLAMRTPEELQSKAVS